MSTWVEQAKNAPLNGFTFDELIHQVVGRASTLMAGDRVFDGREATQVAVEARDAALEFLRCAINQQGIDANADMADWELAELIAQAPCFGIEVDG